MDPEAELFNVLLLLVVLEVPVDPCGGWLPPLGPGCIPVEVPDVTPEDECDVFGEGVVVAFPEAVPLPDDELVLFVVFDVDPGGGGPSPLDGGWRPPLLVADTPVEVVGTAVLSPDWTDVPPSALVVDDCACEVPTLPLVVLATGSLFVTVFEVPCWALLDVST